MQSVGEVIKEMRVIQRLKQDEFAKKCNVSQGYLSKIEQGLMLPNLNFLKNLREIFGFSIDQILDESEL